MGELDQAIEHHQAGRLKKAEALYRQILQDDPQQPDALHLLGVLAAQSGDPHAGINSIERAIAINPDNAEYHNNLAQILRSVGRLNGAITEYRTAITLKPTDVKAHHNLGNVLLEHGDTHAAIAAYLGAVALEDGSAELHSNLGLALQAQGKLTEAVDHLRRAVTLEPESSRIFFNLANVLRLLGDLPQAIETYRKALTLEPNSPDVCNNLGATLAQQGAFTEATRNYRQALSLKADFHEAQNNLGIALLELSRPQEALAAFQQAVILQPNFGEAYNNIANVLKSQGKLDDAVIFYRHALSVEASAETHANFFLCMHYIAGFSAEDLYTEARRWDALYAKPLAPRVFEHDNDRTPARRLRIGYVSADFHRHPVGFFVLPVFANHDKEQFEVFAYADVHGRDELTQRFAGYADHWREMTGMSDELFTKQIRADRIDILVDLAGHTGENRLLVFARKPAPIQVSGGGNNDTTGLDAMDYLLSDRFHTPTGSERYFSETLSRLPNDYVCYAPPDYAPAVALPPCQRRGYVTFGCFNNIAKINSEVIALWAQILAALPGARLKLQTRELSDAGTRERYHSLFAAAGIEPQRVDLAGRVSHERLLATYADIDIALDPFPYSGGLTTCEALWMGVPVITLTGKTFAGRHSTSHLSNVGLPELITTTPEQYVATTLALAQDPQRLTTLRQNLRERMAASPLCDAKGYTRDLEAAYRGMWVKYCEASSE
jgi:protein O-GlcNAc transferase